MSTFVHTTLYIEEIEDERDVTLEWEAVSVPSGKPDPNDPLSEGSVMEPEMIEFTSGDAGIDAILAQKQYQDQLKEIMWDTFNFKEDEDIDDYQEDFNA